MSKLLKVIVNTLLLLAILSAGALVIPPFAGITTLVSDGMGNTNISRGAVTYAKETDTSSVATGEKILVDDNSGKYIYTIQSLDTAAGTASVKNVISGDTTEITVRATVSKVIVTIPVIGSMAAQSREGIMIIGLAILFLVILFILSEVWKRDEEEEDDEEEEEDEDDEKASEELRSRKKAALEEKKKREEQEMTEQLRAADQKTADEFEIPDLEEEETEQVSFNTVDLQNLVRGEETEEIPEAVEETEIVEEAAAEETAEEVTEETEETESAEPETVEEIEEFEETIEEPEEEPKPEPSEPIELAMPVYTAEELLQKAHAAGDDPKVIEDPATGITILDYSDIL